MFLHVLNIFLVDVECESLENFEALMALGNLASLNESVRKISMFYKNMKNEKGRGGGTIGFKLRSEVQGYPQRMTLQR